MAFQSKMEFQSGDAFSRVQHFGAGDERSVVLDTGRGAGGYGMRSAAMEGNSAVLVERVLTQGYAVAGCAGNGYGVLAIFQMCRLR